MNSEIMFTLINTVITFVATVAIVITVIYVARQTKMMRQSINDIKRQMRIDSIVSQHDHTREVNAALCEDEELASDFEYTKRDITIYSIINNMELRWILRNEGVISDEQWQAHATTIAQVMNKSAIRSKWTQVRGEYHPGFGKYIDQVLMAEDAATH